MSAKILIVDDDAELREALIDQLALHEEFESIGVETGAGGVQAAKAGEIDLSLHLSRTSDGETMLLGIITSTNAAETVDAFEGVAVDLYSAPGPLLRESDGKQRDTEDATPILSTQVDDVGNIFLEPVPPGDYVMIVHLPDQEVVIEGLTINHG